jgi:hypothetical protein
MLLTPLLLNLNFDCLIYRISGLSATADLAENARSNSINMPGRKTMFPYFDAGQNILGYPGTSIKLCPGLTWEIVPRKRSDKPSWIGLNLTTCKSLAGSSFLTPSLNTLSDSPNCISRNKSPPNVAKYLGSEYPYNELNRIVLMADRSEPPFCATARAYSRKDLNSSGYAWITGSSTSIALDASP